MTLSFLLGGGVGTEPHGIELYETYPLVRDLYARIGEWTGLDAEQILRGELPAEQERRQSVGSIREVALALGVHDVLAEAGAAPDTVGGLSLGGLTAACLAGAVDRERLFAMLVRAGEFPDPAADAPAQGLALAFVPTGEDVADYHATPHVHLAGTFGNTVDGSVTLVMLGGHADALVALATEHGAERVVVLPGRTIAVHTPLRATFTRFLADHVAAMPLQAPSIPLFSCLESRVLTSAEDVRDLFRRNPTTPITLSHLTEQMHAAGTHLCVVVGPAIPQGMLAFPFPVVHVERPEHVEQTLTAVYETGALT